MSFRKTATIMALAIGTIIAPAGISHHADAEAEGVYCITRHRIGDVTTSFINSCNQKVRWSFEITGGWKKYGNRPCDTGYKGGFFFGPGVGPIDLIPTGCGYNSWEEIMD